MEKDICSNQNGRRYQKKNKNQSAFAPTRTPRSLIIQYNKTTILFLKQIYLLKTNINKIDLVHRYQQNPEEHMRKGIPSLAGEETTGKSKTEGQITIDSFRIYRLLNRPVSE